MAIGMIDQTAAICRDHLQNIDALASELVTAFAPVREPVLAALTRARHLRGEAVRGEVGLMSEPLRAAAAPGLRKEAGQTRESAHQIMGLTLGDAFPFIAWPDFPRETLARCDSHEAVRSLLAHYFNDHLD